jgi:N-acetylglutamate synthase-like GNAT family acetyltransferase
MNSKTESPASPISRVATAGDVDILVPFINQAFARDNYFKRTERTSYELMAKDMATGTFLMLEQEDELLGVVYAHILDNGHGYIGTVAVNPDQQNRGTGRQLMSLGEAFCREQGCTVFDVSVINLRPELVQWYARLGYRVIGEAPYVRPEALLQPCHFILMEKDV